MEQPNREAEIVKRDEITVKDLILKVQELIRYLKTKWLVIILCGILGGGLGIVASIMKRPMYVATLSFVLEENSKGGGLGNYAGIASSLGFDLGGGGNSGIFAGDNIIEFLRSRLMVENALLKPVTINGRQTNLAEYYIQINDLRKRWEKNPRLANVHYPAGQDRASFTLVQDSILSELHEVILKRNMSVAKPDKKLSFINVSCMSPDELFSKTFTELLVQEATRFYVETKTQRSKVNVDYLQAKADSIMRLLDKKTYSAALAQDLNLNPARSVATVNTELVTRDKVVLQTMYAEVVKNLELSRMNMAQETPIIQVVDRPILPLKKERLSIPRGVATGVFAGVFISILLLLAMRVYRGIMRS